MNNLNRDAFIVNDLVAKTNFNNLSERDKKRFHGIKTSFYETKKISEFDLSELRRLRALSNRVDVRWLYQDVEARFDTVFNPARPR